jgi:hypothetical protein
VRLLCSVQLFCCVLLCYALGNLRSRMLFCLS